MLCVYYVVCTVKHYELSYVLQDFVLLDFVLWDSVLIQIQHMNKHNFTTSAVNTARCSGIIRIDSSS